MKFSFLTFILIFYSNVLNTTEFTGKFEQGSFIIGNNVTAREANTIYLSGRVVNSTNYIQAGRNEILNPFSDSIINYRSGSRNSIRELGSNDIIQVISGGRDSIL